jgi:hephaestin
MKSYARRGIVLGLLGLAALGAAACGDDDSPAAPHHTTTSTPKTRLYAIAADEVAWDYAPSGVNLITGAPFDDEASVFVQNGPDRIGKVYVKALYREYTDTTFTTLKPVAAEWAHLGTLGPVIRAEVGDTIRVVFRNNAQLPYTIHAHGVFYTKGNEGAPYDDGTDQHDDDDVPPGGTYTYTWTVPDRAGPGHDDGSSIVWMYHSHISEPKDTNAGLIGPIIITARGSAKADGTPVDVDREFVTMFTVFDENDSWYLDRNIATYAGDPSSVDADDEDFQESNLMHAINGYVYGNLPLGALTMRKGERVRWYLLGMGTEVDIHTPHWHGQTGLMMGTRTDMVALLPASMVTFDMVADNPGVWLYHCHVNDHIKAGMLARFEVTPTPVIAKGG